MSPSCLVIVVVLHYTSCLFMFWTELEVSGLFDYVCCALCVAHHRTSCVVSVSEPHSGFKHVFSQQQSDHINIHTKLSLTIDLFASVNTVQTDQFRCV